MSFLNIWTPTDIANGQKQLLSDATATDQGISVCVGADATTKQEWGTFLANVKTFCAIEPGWLTSTGRTVDELQSLQSELFAWQQRLQGMKCNVLPHNPTPPGASLDPSIISALRWGSVLAGSLAAAYVVGKISTTMNLFGAASVLKSSQRESRRVLRSRAYR